MSKITIAVIIIIIAVVGYWFYRLTLVPEEETLPEGSKECVVNDDCVVFGKDGDCNCGCYNKNYLPSGTGGECFCAAPISCKCSDNECQGVFEGEVDNFDKCVEAGYPILQSYPRQCKISDMQTFVEEHCIKEGTNEILTLADAEQIAIDSECGDRLKENHVCNKDTGTWWIDLDIERQGCSPACVVNVVTREASINWRCTGLIE